MASATGIPVVVGSGIPANAVGPDGQIYIDLDSLNTEKLNAFVRSRNKFFALDHLPAVILAPVTVANLPAPQIAMKGWRATVTDATQAVSSVSFAAIVTGGGANNLPVWCDGTNWRVG